MERIAVFFRLKRGKAEGYKQRHDEIWPEMRVILAKAGIRNYSIWRLDDMLFGYYETDDNESTAKFLQQEPVYHAWRRDMEEYIDKEAVTGRKEWPMEMMFLQE